MREPERWAAAAARARGRGSEEQTDARDKAAAGDSCDERASFGCADSMHFGRPGECGEVRLAPR